MSNEAEPSQEVVELKKKKKSAKKKKSKVSPEDPAVAAADALASPQSDMPNGEDIPLSTIKDFDPPEKKPKRLKKKKKRDSLPNAADVNEVPPEEKSHQQETNAKEVAEISLSEKSPIKEIIPQEENRPKTSEIRPNDQAISENETGDDIELNLIEEEEVSAYFFKFFECT